MTHLRHSPILRAAGSVAMIFACVPLLTTIHHIDMDQPFLIHGMLDWAGHLVTAMMLAIGIRALRLPIPIWSILIGGIVLDLGHLPQMLDILPSLEGSSRNGSHSVSVVAILAGAGFVDRRHANIWLGIAIGALSHLWRDMGTGTVALIWPIRDTVYGTLFSHYVAGLAGAAIALVGSAALLDLHARSRRSGAPSMPAPPDWADPRQEGPISHASGWET